MSVGRILTLGLGTPFGAVKYLPTLGYGWAVIPPVPPTPIVAGGAVGGGRLHPGPRKAKKELEGLWAELYAAIHGLESVPSAQPALKRAVKPFIEAKKAPAVITVPALDMEALKRDLDAVQAIIHLYRKQLEDEEDDEDILLLL